MPCLPRCKRFVDDELARMAVLGERALPAGRRRPARTGRGRPRRPSACSASTELAQALEQQARRLGGVFASALAAARVERGSDETRHDSLPAPRAAGPGRRGRAQHRHRDRALRRAGSPPRPNGSCANCRPSPRHWPGCPTSRSTPTRCARRRLRSHCSGSGRVAAGTRPADRAAQHVGGAGRTAARRVRCRLHAARGPGRPAEPVPHCRAGSGRAGSVLLDLLRAGGAGRAERTAAEPGARVARPTVRGDRSGRSDVPGAACPDRPRAGSGDRPRRPRAASARQRAPPVVADALDRFAYQSITHPNPTDPQLLAWVGSA